MWSGSNDSNPALGNGRSNGHAKTIETSTKVVLIIFVALGALATAWQWTPLRDSFDLAQALDGLQGLDYTPITVQIVLAAFPLSGPIMLPSIVLILATVALFGPVVGSAYAALGCLLSALLRTRWAGFLDDSDLAASSAV